MNNKKLTKIERGFIILSLDLLLDQIKEEAGDDKRRKNILKETKDIIKQIKPKLI